MRKKYIVTVTAEVETENGADDVMQWIKMLIDDQGDDQIIVKRRALTVKI